MLRRHPLYPAELWGQVAKPGVEPGLPKRRIYSPLGVPPPTFAFGVSNRDRTGDDVDHNHALCQLSYTHHGAR